jgi:hypothetical protein
LVIRMEAGENLVVRVTEKNLLLEERVYDQAFLSSGRLDEFTVTASTGQSRMLRYWASFDAAGRPECVPLDQAAPTVPQP